MDIYNCKLTLVSQGMLYWSCNVNGVTTPPILEAIETTPMPVLLVDINTN